MRLKLATLALVTSAAVVHAQAQAPAAERLRPAADQLIDAALRDTTGYGRLAYLVDTFGSRPSGGESLERAIDWILGEMKADGLANVRGEPVMVPHWVRGEERAELVQPRRAPIAMLGLGGSVGTPAGGVTAPVLVVRDFEELDRRAAEAKGKIVLFDHPFRTDLPPFEAYGEAVRYRGAGPSRAARVGAVAALVRTVGPFGMRTPHTGGTRYDTTVSPTRIPAAQVSLEDANLLRRLSERGQAPVVTLVMGARQLPDAPSRNVVAEIRGRERPDEIVVLGGHIDSWDVGQGAMDDAGGSVAAWEAVRLMQRLGLRPRRTVRVVLWTNEENGLRGGREYARAHAAEVAKHVAAMESDNGVFRPNGFRFQGTPQALALLQRLAPLLERVGSDSVWAGDGEADVSPLLALGVPGLGLDVEGSRYFWYHHTQADMLDVVSREDFARCVATMAVMTWAIAEMEEGLPRRP